MIRHLWDSHRWLLLGFVVSLAAVIFFGTRAVLFTLYWSDPAHRDEDIAGWMTPRYIVMSWQVPPEIVAHTLGLPQDGVGRRLSIEKIARDRGVPVADVARDLEAAILAFRASQ
jgi:hypothetical protein